MEPNSFSDTIWAPNLALPAENVAQPTEAFDDGFLFSVPSNNSGNYGTPNFEAGQPTTSGGTTVNQGPQQPLPRLTQRQIEQKSRKKLKNACEKLMGTLSRAGISVQGRANAVDLSARLIDVMIERMDPVQFRAALYEIQFESSV